MHVAFCACEGSSPHSSTFDEAAVCPFMCVNVDSRWLNWWGSWGFYVPDHRLHVCKSWGCALSDVSMARDDCEVPYKRPVSLSIGACVIIKGRPNLSFLNDPQLQVDFYTGTDEDSDIAFHFRVHFGHRVVMNSREFGVWKLEEKLHYVPFEDGEPFDLRIYVFHNQYEVKVNGQYIYGFAHRYPPSYVKMIQVWRDVSLTSVYVYN
uniref:galectin-16-like n=1 Tax=Callithrix jacchus TaxID=9483 RepID=UPI0023DD2551|nr:galectin-16-like [Callithrix jacchus]